MTNRLSIAEAASHFGIKISLPQLIDLECWHEAKLASLRPFTDAEHTVATLLSGGIKIGVCSNLEMAYGPVIKALFPCISVFGFSYDLGVMKTDPVMYRHTCTMLNVELGDDWNGKGRVAMIGDSERCDGDGSRQMRISGFLLRRGGPGGFSNLAGFAQAAIIYA